MIIFLIGYMGSGKSSLGRELARRIGFQFMDMDAEIEKLCGKPISEIFASEGENYFRDCEKTYLQSLPANSRQNAVVATGGGVPCFGDNMDILNNTGITVYLKLSPYRLVERLRHGRDKRPIISGMDEKQLQEFISSNLVSRDPYYSRATMVVDCDGKSDEYIIKHITDYIDRLCKTKM